MKYITGSPRNEETEVDSEATFTALGWFSISILIGWSQTIFFSVKNWLKKDIYLKIENFEKIFFIKISLKFWLQASQPKKFLMNQLLKTIQSC